MIPSEVIEFFHNQHFTVISTIDENGYPHNACKGIVEIDKSGRVYLLDLYTAKTYENLKINPAISITAVDEHKFKGYSLKGRAKIIRKEKVTKRILKMWEDRINNRISHRLLKNMGGEKGHHTHPEALLPTPAYLIAVDVKAIVDLIPPHMKRETEK